MKLIVKFTNNTTFKEIHDLLFIEECDGINLVELDDSVDPNVGYDIACLLKTFNPNLEIIYTTYRKEMPFEWNCFKLNPFDSVILADSKCFIS